MWNISQKVYILEAPISWDTMECTHHYGDPLFYAKLTCFDTWWSIEVTVPTLVPRSSFPYGWYGFPVRDSVYSLGLVICLQLPLEIVAEVFNDMRHLLLFYICHHFGNSLAPHLPYKMGMYSSCIVLRWLLRSPCLQEQYFMLLNSIWKFCQLWLVLSLTSALCMPCHALLTCAIAHLGLFLTS